MQSKGEESVRGKMAELRLVCDREIPIQQQRMDSAVLLFRSSLESTKGKAQATVENQAKLENLKSQLRESEGDLVKAIAVKTRKEARKMAIVDSTSATKARVEEVRRILEDQRARKDEYATIISQMSEVLTASEDKRKKDIGRAEVEEAISWYNRFLGFRVECGHGVKFTFTQVNLKEPNQEYFFTIRHENDAYTLLNCDPHLSDTKELINELNRSNELFKFVRTMREKFQEAATHGISPHAKSLDQQSSSISLSAPVSSVSTDSQSESPAKQKEIQPGETDRQSKKAFLGRDAKSAILSPRSAASVRRSPRVKVRK